MVIYTYRLGVTTVYLTTFDQQEFYAKLGYEFSDPIVVFGGSLKLAAVNQEKIFTMFVSNSVQLCLFILDFIISFNFLDNG